MTLEPRDKKSLSDISIKITGEIIEEIEKARQRLMS